MAILQVLGRRTYGYLYAITSQFFSSSRTETHELRTCCSTCRFNLKSRWNSKRLNTRGSQKRYSTGLDTPLDAGESQRMSEECRDVCSLIRSHTDVSVDHMTPEIRLHLITEGCDLWRAGEDQAVFHDPYWAFYWPGGQALTRYASNTMIISCIKILIGLQLSLKI